MLFRRWLGYGILFFFTTSLCWGDTSDFFNLKDYKINGYVDTSYNYLTKNHQFISGVNNRVNDLAQNGFIFQALSITIANQPKQGLGGLINMMGGRAAYYNLIPGWNPYFGSQTLGFVAPEVYLQYGINDYVFMGGLFQTLMGAEDYQPTLDINFSRSILDGYAEPGSVLGVRAFYTYSPALKFNAGLNNGWDGIRDVGHTPTLELGGTYQQDWFTLLLQGLFGPQRSVTRVSQDLLSWRNMLEMVASVKPIKPLTLVLSTDYAMQRKGLTSEGNVARIVWQGVTGYINYQWNERWRTSLRGEVYDDANGFTTGVAQNWRELTLTVCYAPIKHLEFRAETRHDISNVNAFMNETGPGASNNQQSYGLEALYTFG